MKFLVRAKKERLDDMVVDLEKEKQKAFKIQNSGRWKFASRLMEKTRIGWMSFGVDYERKSDTELYIYTHAVAGAWVNQEQVGKDVIKRAKEYGPDVDITVVPA